MGNHEADARTVVADCRMWERPGGQGDRGLDKLAACGAPEGRDGVDLHPPLAQVLPADESQMARAIGPYAQRADRRRRLVIGHGRHGSHLADSFREIDSTAPTWAGVPPAVSGDSGPPAGPPSRAWRDWGGR